MKFQVIKKVDLSYLGDGWDGCYINVSAMSVREAREMMDMPVSEDAVEVDRETARMMMDIIRDKFVDGEGWDGTKKVKIKKDDLDDLPAQVIASILTELTSGLSPNA